jgi:hypothetical protein
MNPEEYQNIQTLLNHAASTDPFQAASHGFVKNTPEEIMKQHLEGKHKKLYKISRRPCDKIISDDDISLETLTSKENNLGDDR